MTRVIKKEFVLDPADEALTPVTNAGSWSGFMNTYAVWQGSSDVITIRRKIALQAGNYYITGTVDNTGTVNINGININLYNFNTNIARTSLTNNTKVHHPGGIMTIVISAKNTGGPRGVAVTISKENKEWSHPNAALGTWLITIGDLVWSTRSLNTDTTAVYTATMPFKATITAHLWGAGGGGGGVDAGSQGGIGSPGLYNTTTFTVEKNDVIVVALGSNGLAGGSNRGSAPGGAAGKSLINFQGSSTKSFNGGDGSAAGPAPYSGGGGGGGGATVVTKNNELICVAGGGGGGGGAGNDGNSSAQYARRDASINKNSIGKYSPGSLALSLDHTGTFATSSGVVVNNYANFNKLTLPPSEVGTSTVCVFGLGGIKIGPSGAQNRSVTTNSKINLVSSEFLTYYVNRGTESGWGQTPDSNEELRLQYSIDGSTWVTIQTIPIDVTPNTWIFKSVPIPFAAKIASGGVFLRFYQTTTGGFVELRDTWAITSLWNGSPTLDFRGENGQTKGGDGGGAGGGGGGYPGGEGGAVFPGDTSGYAGLCGGNFPDNEPTTGRNIEHYISGYGLGGSTAGNGTSGLAVLIIEPISSGSAVKVAGEWKQITDCFVKVDGNWKTIEKMFVKVNDGNWKQIEKAGTDSEGADFIASNTNWGRVARSYS